MSDIYTSLLPWGKADEIMIRSRPIIEQMLKKRAVLRGEEYVPFNSPENITNIITQSANTNYYLNGRDTQPDATETIEDPKD